VEAVIIQITNQIFQGWLKEKVMRWLWHTKCFIKGLLRV
jgi:hypothetical protein